MMHVGHSPPWGREGAAVDVAASEALLADWFHAPVVLMSSGRAALMAAFDVLDLQRYRDRIAVSPMTSSCVLDAVVRRGFPVDPAARGRHDGALIIHQYGFRQNWRTNGKVVEDICHAFYETATSGARRWVAPLAAFSLPKFLSLAGMVGGVVVSDPVLEQRLRKLVAEAPGREIANAASERATVRDARDLPALEAVYAARLANPAPDPSSLSGLPDLASLRRIGQRRAMVIERFLGCAPSVHLPPGWTDRLIKALPYAFPVFGSEKYLLECNKRLAESGISAGVYHIDISCHSANPKIVPSVLIPCNSYLSDSTLDIICESLS